MFNKVVLVGNLTRDIELRYMQSGTTIANTAIATSRKFTTNGEKREEVMFIDITFFGRSGEIANQYLRKGSKILVEGRIKFDQWVDQNGQKRSKHSISVESMQMLGNKNDSSGGSPDTPQQDYQMPTPSYEDKDGKTITPPNQQMPENNIPEIDLYEDEIPF